jgi:hypothetical protein
MTMARAQWAIANRRATSANRSFAASSVIEVGHAEDVAFVGGGDDRGGHRAGGSHHVEGVGGRLMGEGVEAVEVVLPSTALHARELAKGRKFDQRIRVARACLGLA